MGDVHYVISKLNAAPFNLGLSLISFSEKTPQELLQLLSDVLLKISPKALQQRNTTQQERPEQTAERLAVLLRIIKYPANLDPPSFRQLLAAGDRDAVHGVLKWVLSQGSQLLEKRAFVGYYLTFPEMPEELHYDPQVMELRGEIKELQAEFVDTHKALDAAQQHVRELPALRASIKQMEQEQERLADKVDTAAAQAAALPDASSYRDVCVALRQEHDHEVAISQQLMAQQQQLERAEAAHQRSMARLHEMQQQLHSHGGGSVGDAVDGARLLEVLRGNVAQLRLQVSTQWPRELEGKQSRLAAMQATLNNGINTEGDLQRLLAQEGALRQQNAAAQERLAATERSRAADRAFLPVRQAQQMAALVARKKSELAAKVARLAERQGALAAAAAAAAGGAEGGGAGGEGGGAVSEQEWRARYDAVKGQLPTYKAMKWELADLEAEVFVLQQTEEILRQQDPSYAGQAAGGADMGIGSESFPVDGLLEPAGTRDAAQDVASGGAASLDEVAATIKQRKAQLAPAIQELRSLRSQQQELEAVHAERKAAHDTALGGLEATLVGLSADVDRLQQEAEAKGGELGKASARVQELEGHVQRMGAVGAEELRRRCQAQLAEAEASLQVLREQQRHAEERSCHAEAQLGMLNDLLQLLALKQQQAAAAAAAASGGLSGGRGGLQGGRDALLNTGRFAAAAVPAGGGGFPNTNVMVL